MEDNNSQNPYIAFMMALVMVTLVVALISHNYGKVITTCVELGMEWRDGNCTR